MTAAIDLRSDVCAVTVYRRGAMVTRRAELARDGEHFPSRVQLVGLPLTLDDSSVRVQVHGEGGPVAGDLRVSVSVPGEDPTLPPPSDEELEAAELAHALIEEELAGLEQAATRLGKLSIVGRGAPEEGKAPAPSPTAARLELLAFRRERAEQLDEKLLDCKRRLIESAERLDTLRERQRLASSQRNVRSWELRKAAILSLERPSDAGPNPPKSLRIELRYFVPGARWAPAYTLRLDPDMRGGSLELRALVGQATGEDWRGVDLTLSTASPQQWTELPELESLRIGRRQPSPARTGWRPPPVGAEELYADYDRELGEVAPPSAPPAPRSQPMPSSSAGPAGPPPPSAPPPQAAPSAPAQGAVMASADLEADDDLMLEERGGPVSPAVLLAQQSRSRAFEPESAPLARKSGGLGAMVGGALDAAAAAFGAGGDGSHMLTLDGPAPEPAAPPGELLAGRELLDYGRLRLYEADDPRRGSLHRIETRALYRQISVETLDVELAITHIREASQAARALESRRAPAGHHWPKTEAGFDYAYLADAPCDLASDGDFHSLAIASSSLEATPRYVSVPRETQDVFRIVALRNPLDAPLLPGPADVYVDGRFALSTQLELTPDDGRIELGLGVEQAIKVARNAPYNEDSSGMFKRSLELHHSLELEIANHLPRPATVEVRERLPQIREGVEDVGLELLEVDPPWEDYEPTTHELEGGRVWIVEVPAGESRELKARYVITIPKDRELVGGNRREV